MPNFVFYKGNRNYVPLDFLSLKIEIPKLIEVKIKEIKVNISPEFPSQAKLSIESK
jgi:hypothetical protein